jgi:hypothetical protein
VGGNDFPVIEMNRAALGQLRCEKRLVIIPGATHLFEEPGALAEVARLGRDWFERYLAPAETPMTGAGTPTLESRSRVDGVRSLDSPSPG